ncbi:MAG: hypothetical protein EON59_15895 [Alphaproteobacteria bacterium]|nr:MAG: hypothetical protein EON59_15895 [Alphaproteobacteria bacterium]
MRWILLPLTLLTLTGAARVGDGDMSALERWYAPKLQNLLKAADGVPIPWQSHDVKPERCDAEVLYGQPRIIGVLVRLSYAAGAEQWTDILNFQRTPTSWLLNNVLYESGGNLRFRLFEGGGQ